VLKPNRRKSRRGRGLVVAEDKEGKGARWNPNREKATLREMWKKGIFYQNIKPIMVGEKGSEEEEVRRGEVGSKKAVHARAWGGKCRMTPKEGGESKEKTMKNGEGVEGRGNGKTFKRQRINRKMRGV